jgi:hypothetical protein
MAGCAAGASANQSIAPADRGARSVASVGAMLEHPHVPWCRRAAAVVGAGPAEGQDQ